MEQFYFSECSITREPNVQNGSLSMDLTKEISEQENGSYHIKLTLDVTKSGDDLHVRVVANAIFSMDNDDVELVRSLMEVNTVAIMFPFIRSQVSLLTTQPGMTPIIIPPINTAKFKS